MSIKERVKRLELKAGGTGNFSLIPERERIIVAAGYSESEREAKMSERLAEMHKKFGAFDESGLTQIYIRKFRLNGGVVEG